MRVTRTRPGTTHSQSHSEKRHLWRGLGPRGGEGGSKTRQVELRPRTKRILWTTEEDETLVKMKDEDGCLWEEISTALFSRTLGAIQVRYSTKLSSGTGSRKHCRLRGFLSTEFVSPAEKIHPTLNAVGFLYKLNFLSLLVLPT